MYIYTTENDTLNLKNEIETRGEVNAVDYDATGKFLAVSGYARIVNVYDTTSYEVREYIIYNSNFIYVNVHVFRVTNVYFIYRYIMYMYIYLQLQMYIVSVVT